MAYCKTHKIPFVSDPSNANADYARVRLRQAMPVLEAEGLSEKRLAVTAARLQRAREALEFYTQKLARTAMVAEKDKVTFDLVKMMKAPEEIRIRAVRHGLSVLDGDGYGPRLDRLEDLLCPVFDHPETAKRFTLGGFIFTPDVKRGRFVIGRE
jgi:tRNA(Ile)-lysidine synthase